MNANTVYESATTALRSLLNDTYDAEKADKFYHKIINSPESFYTMPAFYLLGKMAREALEEIESKDGKKSILRACKNIIKSANREDCAGAWIDGEGWQIVCDGYRAIRMREPLSALPKANGIEMKAIFERARANNKLAVPLPTIGAVKAHIAAEKADGKRKNTITWDFGEHLPQVDAHYLLDLLLIDGITEVMVNEGDIWMSMLYAACDGVEALLLPVRKVGNNG